MDREAGSVKERQYLEDLFPEPTELFEKARQNGIELNRDYLRLSAREARTLGVLVRLAGCRSFFEIGTFTGYSALWILWGMTEGKLYTFEKDPQHAQLAADVFKQWQGRSQAEVVLGDAVERLKEFDGKGPFDGIFIDGNKNAYPEYLDWAERNIRSGGLIVADNVFLGGGVYGEPKSEEYSAKQFANMQGFNKRLADPKRYQSVVLPTAEGLLLAFKL